MKSYCCVTWFTFLWNTLGVWVRFFGISFCDSTSIGVSGVPGLLQEIIVSVIPFIDKNFSTEVQANESNNLGC